MPGQFDKYWNDPKKHYKRIGYWLPAARRVAGKITGNRPFRYFTLCAHSMIDVFMLAREGILRYDDSVGTVRHVQFCECDPEQYPEIKELVGIEDSGFLGTSEDLVLFEEEEYSVEFPTVESIDAALEDEGLNVERREILQNKRTHFYLRSSFPYDFINLDFCGYYYQPPSILRINQTVERVLEWQRLARIQEDEGGKGSRLRAFALSVTCRHDREFPEEAERRLSELVKTNCQAHAAYKEYLEGRLGITDIDGWVRGEKEDFILSTWPKEICRVAKQCGWDMEICGYVHYDRVGDDNQPYKIACLVCRFREIRGQARCLKIALHALDSSKREFVKEIKRKSKQGQRLMRNLAKIVKFRNQQAKLRQRPLLPEP